MEKKDDMKYNNTTQNENQGIKSPTSNTNGRFFKFNIFRRSKTEENPGFINRTLPAYFYDGKS